MGFSARRGRVAGAVAALAASAVLLSGCTGGDMPEPQDMSTPLPDGVTEQLQSATERAMQAGGAPGAIVGVWAPWAGEWAAGVGETAPGSGETPSTEMSFRAGEITRSMTCDVLYALDGDRVVDLEDPVTTYVPSTPQLEDRTLVDLCNGLGGLKESTGARWNVILGNPDRVWTPREFIAAGLGRGLGNPNTWGDTDTAYFLLGIALENAAHTSMRDLYARYVAEPQGLDATYLPIDAAGTPGTTPFPGFYTSNAARESGCEGEPKEMTELSASFGYADRGVVSSLDDLRDYASERAGRAGSSDDLAPRWAESSPTSSDGPQWIRAAGGDLMMGSMIGQQGEMPGYSTAAYSDVNTGLTVVVALNNSAAGGELAGALARELAAIAAEAPGESDVDAALPWTTDQAHQAVADAAVCPID
ncbi:serine hydrolase [Microbacterium sp. G2-8]|uniref:serine hydrolase domain-containing protein n=1 Tax=Microbacterium sp. G2-8 TaxID=2842454 RepID=UPI001C89BF75|nr:serine hydrolase domain-containing protein [Microbacterium sp. G2-8]